MKRNIYPELNELVLFKITSIDEIAVYGNLVEYNRTAMMIFAEVSARRIKSIYQHVKEGQEIVALVTQLDTERGYINLSRKQVTPDDKESFMSSYSNRKKVNTILYKISLKYNCNISDLYNKLWILFDDYNCLYVAFKQINIDNSILNKVELDDYIKKDLLECIAKMCEVPLQTFSGEIKLHCFHPDGIDIIKDAVKYANENMKDNNISVHYIAAPLYELKTRLYDNKTAEELFTVYADTINNYVKDKQGYCQFTRIITDTDKLKVQADEEL